MTDKLPLWQYLEQREEEIVQMRKELQRELEALREARSAIENGARVRKRDEPREKLTIKDMIRSVLARNPEGGTSDQIINWIHQAHDIEVARTSLSPQLSRLKADEEVELDDDLGIWSLRLEPRRVKFGRESELRELLSPATTKRRRY